MITSINEFRKINEGRGNTIIRFDGVNYPTYYISYYEPDEEEHDNDNYNDSFVDDVVGNMTHFKSVNLIKLTPPEHLDYDQSAYFETDVFKVVFADNEWSMAVGCIPVFTYDENGEETYDETIFKAETKKFFDELLTIYNLRKATSAWTSTEVESIQEKKKISKAARKFISNKIKFLIDEEGKDQKQAIAMAYSYAKKDGLLENKITLQQDHHDKLKVNLTEEQIMSIAKSKYKCKNINDVKKLGSSDYDKLIADLHKKYINENVINENANYYSDQLAKVDLEDVYSPMFKFINGAAGSGATNNMNLNKESATVLMNWLQANMDKFKENS